MLLTMRVGGRFCSASHSKSERLAHGFRRRHRSMAVAASGATGPTFDGVKVPENLQSLFTPLKLGDAQLEHRLVLAPLTRCRAIGTVPQPAAAVYYAQRATKGGLLISEATPICVEGHGYPQTPGIYTDEQIDAWKPVVEAVHKKGGVFYCQIWHVGRASHPDFQPEGKLPVSSSAIAISESWGGVYTSKGGPFPYPVPRALELDEIPGIIKLYATAAKNCIAAGFDGVEIHGANGYLLDQFLKDEINQRTDAYGGSIENRARLMLEVAAAVAEAVGPGRTGIRLGPFATFLGNGDSHPYATMTYVVEELNKLGLAYIHMIEPRLLGNDDIDSEDSLVPFKSVCKTNFMAAGGYKGGADAAAAISSGRCDLVAFGRQFLANPDLPKRILLNHPLNKYDRNTFYSWDQVMGYTDYPTMEELAAAKK